jgi:Na+/H+-translocating membrane pyrophosphatase
MENFNVHPTIATIVAGFILANAAGMIGAYISIQVNLRTLKFMVNKLNKDVNHLFAKHRNEDKLRESEE